MNTRRPAGAWRDGNILVLSAVLLVVVLVIAAMAIDAGYVMLWRARAQTAADAAALAGCGRLNQKQDVCEEIVDETLGMNHFDTTAAGVSRVIEYGDWDEVGRDFTVGGDYATCAAVRVRVGNDRVESFFGRVLGVTQNQVTAQAVAVRANTPRDVVIVLDCSKSMSTEMSNGKSRVHNARNAAKTLVDQLGDDDRSALAVYSWWDLSRNLYQETGKVEQLLSYDHVKLKDLVGACKAGKYATYTNIGGGLRAGLDVFLQSAARTDHDNVQQELVILTDGLVNRCEPYPTSTNETGVLPPPPYDSGVDERLAVSLWAQTIKTRGIKIYVVTLSDDAYDTLMVDVASPDQPNATYYYHIADGSGDDDALLNAFRSIGRGRTALLVQ